jgi:hypothetical protein
MQKRERENLNYDKDYLDQDESEIHHELFNMDYYIIGYYQANKWLEDQVFNVIETIKEYENDNFGEVNTDFSSSENVVNMYVYIVGESILYDLIKEIKEEIEEKEEENK